jgi:hypothetical protein
MFVKPFQPLSGLGNFNIDFFNLLPALSHYESVIFQSLKESEIKQKIFKNFKSKSAKL